MNSCARFDDHTPGSEQSFALRGLERTVTARRRDEVLTALAEVQHAVDDGWWAAGYVSYEAAPAFDRALTVRPADRDDPFGHLPLVWFGIFERREELEPFRPRGGPPPYTVSAWRPELDRDGYTASVAAIRGRIADGDTSQVNHTFRLRAAFSGDPSEFYRDLVLAQRGAYGASLDIGRYRVLSASPERFFKIVDGEIEVRPMKGTIRRGRWSGEDDEMATRLLTTSKERAENLMIVDLLRSDLGRMARFGTVNVDELLAIERYESLWQLTSTISATLKPGTGLGDVLGALFPSGSVTGAPKAKTMQIIRGLERSPRGVYCGAIGFLAPPDYGGTCSFSVAIRTVVIDVEEGLAEYGVGGAITWDSDADAEFEEARLKARLLVERRPDFDLLETLRWDPLTGFVLLEAHLARMSRSAVYFGFAAEGDLIKEALEKEVAGGVRPLRVRVMVTRDGGIVTESEALDDPFYDHIDGAPDLHVSIAAEPVSSTDVFLFHTTTNRGVYDERTQRYPYVDDVILTNERGEVTESTVSNLVVRFGDRWWTPPIDSGCLAGTYRDRLIQDGVLRERAIAAHELFSADDLALVNSVRGWRRAILAD